LACWHVGTLACWHVGMLACWHVGMLARWHVGMLACWHVGTLLCWHVDMLACWHVGMLARCCAGMLAQIEIIITTRGSSIIQLYKIKKTFFQLYKFKKCKAAAALRQQSYNTYTSELLCKASRLELILLYAHAPISS